MARICIIFCALLLPLYTYAQTGTIKGSVYDPIREVGLDAQIYLLSSDSSVVCSTLSWPTFDEAGREDRKTPHWFKIQNVQGKKNFILKIECHKYETHYLDIKADFSNRDREIDVGEVWMTREVVNFKEVTVQGTRLLMVNKGDTTVYNVASLVNSEGDMLADLIEKLPGAELKDGKIYVNGRYIEKLLIGGKDFFNGNIGQALRQLPAYTVGKIKTYEMLGDASELTGHDMGDKQFVMDVIMKKQYNAQWLCEFMLAGGTKHRYNALGRTFYFDDRKMFSLVGETNNLGRSVNDFSSSYLRMNSNPTGDIDERSAHVNYRFEPSRDFNIGVRGGITNKCKNTLQRTSTETYLEQSNNYSWSYNNERAVETSAVGRISLGYKPIKSLKLDIKYDFNYHRNHITDFSRSFSSLDNPNGLFNTSIIDSVFIWPSTYSVLRRWVQTRLQQKNSHRGNSFQHNTSLAAKKAMGKNILTFDVNFDYNNSNSKAYNLFHLDYPISSLADDYRHRLNDNKNELYDLNASTNYTISFEGNDHLTGWIQPFLKYHRNYTNSNNPLYRLDWAEDDMVSDLEILPFDAQVLLNTIDPANSVKYRQYINRYETGIGFQSDVRFDGKTWMRFVGKFPFETWHGDLSYCRFDSLFHSARTDFLLNLEVSARISLTPDDREGNRHTMGITYFTSNHAVDLIKTLDFTDSADPLIITKGNPNLNNALIHNFKWNIKFEQRERMRMFESSIRYALQKKTIGYERQYSPTTGILTQTLRNIDGNWVMQWSNWFIAPLRRDQKVILDGSLNWEYQRSKDLNTAQASTSVVQYDNSVGTSQASLSLNLLYKPTRNLYFKWQFHPTWNNIRGTRSDFESINAYHIYYSFETWANLPYGINVSSKLNVNSRYGFADDSLCKTYFLWNAKVERSFGKRMTLSLEASDILQQNNGISVIIDAQGRTETFQEKIPSYILLGFKYKIGK